MLLTSVEIDKSLDLKIEELFTYRAFGELYALTGEKKTILADFHIRLKNLQASIYYLDAYLEEHWVLDENIIKEKWSLIHQCLFDLGIAYDKVDKYTSHILKYEKHERAIREGMLPSKYTLKYYYFYKSCDVKLMRRLITERFPTLKNLFNLTDWKLFDLVTEINDDATDIFEDITTINGNSILLSNLLLGKNQTEKQFITFLNELSQLNKRWKYSEKPWAEKIKIFTEENIEATKRVLLENLNNFTSEHKSASRILPHLNNLI